MPALFPRLLGECPICGRDLIEGRTVNAHHLVPKAFKGTDTILIHTVCHSKIHSVFTERELLQHYHTVERLKTHPEIEKFIRWVAKKDPEFRSRNETHKGKFRRK